MNSCVQTILYRTDEANMNYKIMPNDKFHNLHLSLNTVKS